MSKKNMKIIVVAPVGWSDYPSLKKALDELLQPYDGPQFEIEIVVPYAPIGVNKLSQLWAAERGYLVGKFQVQDTAYSEAWGAVNRNMVSYCITDPDAKLIAFIDDNSPEIMHLVGRFKDRYGDENITLITI